MTSRAAGTAAMLRSPTPATQRAPAIGPGAPGLECSSYAITTTEFATWPSAGRSNARDGVAGTSTLTWRDDPRAPRSAEMNRGSAWRSRAGKDSRSTLTPFHPFAAAPAASPATARARSAGVRSMRSAPADCHPPA